MWKGSKGAPYSWEAEDVAEALIVKRGEGEAEEEASWNRKRGRFTETLGHARHCDGSSRVARRLPRTMMMLLLQVLLLQGGGEGRGAGDCNSQFYSLTFSCQFQFHSISSSASTLLLLLPSPCTSPNLVSTPPFLPKSARCPLPPVPPFEIHDEFLPFSPFPKTKTTTTTEMRRRRRRKRRRKRRGGEKLEHALHAFACSPALHSQAPSIAMDTKDTRISFRVSYITVHLTNNLVILFFLCISFHSNLHFFSFFC